MTYDDNIFNPFIDFKLNDIEFPLELREIVLGPNCPEKNLNKVQLEELIRQKRRVKKSIKDENGDDQETNVYSIDKLKVEVSSINNYRHN